MVVILSRLVHFTPSPAAFVPASFPISQHITSPAALSDGWPIAVWPHMFGIIAIFIALGIRRLGAHGRSSEVMSIRWPQECDRHECEMQR